MFAGRRLSALCAVVVLLATLSAPRAVPAAGAQRIFLPAISALPAWRSPLGFELASSDLQGAAVAAPISALGAGWVRLNIVSWRDVQPDEAGAYNWQAPSIALLERELAAATTLRLTPIVVVDDAPRWATRLPTACGAIRADKFAAFAQFAAALVERYSAPPYNVRYWELGNEPDVDPSLVPPDQVYGCWGDISDPYYGGEHYGAMLKVVTPAIKAVDGSAQVVIGGLLLSSPATTLPGRGKPEHFFEGILRALAPDSDQYFDSVAYHLYAAWSGVDKDESGLDALDAWNSYGGLALGKPAFLRGVMQRYGVQKPLLLNETALLCWPGSPSCQAEETGLPQVAQFLESQANFALRMAVRSLAGGAQAITWYTLDGPGWRNSGLLGTGGRPRPVLAVYRGLSERIRNTATTPAATTAYGAGLEAYRFTGDGFVVDVLWSRDTTADTVRVPEALFVAAYGRDGAPVDPASLRRANGNVEVVIGFMGGYIQRRN